MRVAQAWDDLLHGRIDELYLFCRRSRAVSAPVGGWTIDRHAGVLHTDTFLPSEVERVTV